MSTEVSALGAIIAVMADDIHSASAPFDGRWWIPDDPDRVVGGRLSLIGELWDLTLMGWLGPWDPNERPHSHPAIVYGEIGTTPVTLLEVVSGGWKAKTSREPPYTSSVRVNRIILGAHTDGEALYKAAAVRLLHLNEWANRRKFTTETGEGFSSDTVVYAQPPTLEAELPGAKASLWSQWSQSHDLMLSYVSMTANEWVLFDFETPLSLAMIEHDYATPLANLLELVSNRPTAFFEFTVTPEGAGEGDQPWSVLSNEARGPVPSPRNPFELIFTLRDVDFDTVLPRWWRMQPDIGVVPGLLSSLRGRSSVANHFLNAASAIESYHRHLIRDVRPSAEHKALLKRIRDALARADWAWLKQFLIHSHEPSFAQRIDAVVARSGTLFPAIVGNVEAWSTWVKKARDSVAHRDPGMVSIEAEWLTAVRVTETIKWMLTLVLLRDMGIPDEVIVAGMQKEGGLDNAKELMRQQRPDWFAIGGDEGGT